MKTGGLVRMAAVTLLPMMLVQQSLGWGSDGHKMINRVAGDSLPKDVPVFLRNAEAVNALEYYGPDPDRWRDSTEPLLRAAQEPEHFIDLEWADLLGDLPRKRYDYIRALAYAQKAHPELALTPEKVGLQPYVTTEIYDRMKVAMRQYRTLLAANEDTKPVEAEVVYLAGILGHYVADGSNPLHASMQYNGWTGENPNGYTTLHKIHSQFESAFVRANIKAKDISPLVGKTPVVLGDVFADYMTYLRHSHSLVGKVYQLEKAGGFTDKGSAESRAFTEERLAAGATELRDMIYTAWIRSADPVPPYKGS